MKTHTNSDTQLKGLPVQSSKSVVGTGTSSTNTSSSRTTDTRPRIDMAKRTANRQLATRDLLALLRSEAPSLYEIAQVVGTWVWVQFADKQPPEVTSVLAQLGFHWNNKRQVWQHPCGVLTEGSPDDPREKYGTLFAADAQPA